MATQYSTLLKIALPTQGELSGSWGNVVNDNITKMVEEAIAGTATINTWSTNSATLSTANGTTAESRNAILNLTDTSTSLSGAATVIVPTLSKTFIVKNGTAQTVTVKTSSGTGVAITAGETCFVYCDGTNVVEAVNRVAGNFDIGGNLTVAGNATVTGTTTFNGGTITLGDANTDNIVFGGEVDSNIIPDDDGAYDLGSASKEWKDIYIDGSAYIDGLAEDMLVATDKKILFRDSAIFINSSADGQLDIDADTEVEITTTTVDLNGNLDVSGTSTLTGNVTLGGQLRMPDNTASKLLIADGTSYEEKAVGDLSEISTVANDDVFLAVDTSGGGLKKIARSTIVAGLATSGAIANVVEDSTPQLGGNLDMNGNDIVTTSNATIDLAPNGTGTVVVRGNTNSGRIVFNCESNSHGQTLASQPHSAAVTNTMLLPAGSSSTLVSLISTDTLTNKTLTSPVLNTATVGTSIVPASADGATLGTASAEFSDLFLADGGTIQFGNDQDVTLTHVADTGLLLNAASVVQFRDSAINIGSPADGDLDINADDEIELNSTLIDINGAVDISGATTVGGILKTDDTTEATSTTDGSLQTDGGLSVVKDAVFGDDVMLLSDSAVLKFGADSDVTLTHAADTSLTCNLMMAATTFEPSADTAAGDNAAIGYTSAEGLILTGQGSSTDVTIKNDADATVASIATGTTIFTMNDDVGVSGRAVGHVTTDNDGSFDLAVGNDFKCTTAGNLTLTFTNAAAGQSGNIMFINGSNHTISAHADVAINADVLTTISASGTYHLAYYCSAASGNNTILVSASAALT